MKLTWAHIQFILNRYALFALNNSDKWRELEKMLPGIEISSRINTPETIDRSVLRFQYNNGVFEYNGLDIIAVE